MKTRKAKLMLVGGLVVCALGAFAWATPPFLFTATNIVGPSLVGEIDTKAETDDWEIELRTRGLSDVYMTEIKIAPGGHGGWHSHPGPSFICVKSGTATFYDDCDDFERQQFAAGTGFVEDADCIHLLANEGDVELVVVVMQIVPFGAPRRLDQPDPTIP